MTMEQFNEKYKNIHLHYGKTLNALSLSTEDDIKKKNNTVWWIILLSSRTIRIYSASNKRFIKITTRLGNWTK